MESDVDDGFTSHGDHESSNARNGDRSIGITMIVSGVAVLAIAFLMFPGFSAWYQFQGRLY